MTTGKNGELTLMFENVVVQDSNFSTSKEFQNVTIELAGKEIYIGSHYKVKWKNVASLSCKNNVDEIDIESNDDGANNPGLLQAYRDSDYERAGFELVCSNVAKRKRIDRGMSIERFDQGGASNEDLRKFLVRFPVPSEGQRLVGTIWEAFRKMLEGGYKRETNKRRKKQDKERARREEELRQQQQDLRRSKARGRSTRTYSKRPYDFMRKNAANIAANAEVWTDDEEEAPVGSNSPETTPELVSVDEAAEQANLSDDGVRGEESENEFHNDYGEGNTNSEHNKIDDDHSIGAFDEDDSDRVEDIRNDDEALGETLNQKGFDDKNDTDAAKNRFFTESSSSSQLTKTKRIKRRAPVLKDSDDEDDKLFENDTAELTTPAATFQRVVTPAVSKATSGSNPKQKSRRFVDEDDDNEEQENGEKEEVRSDDTDEEITDNNNKKINSFFQPRSKTHNASKDNISPINRATTKDLNSEVATTDTKSPQKAHTNGDNVNGDATKEPVLTGTSDEDNELASSASMPKSTTNSFFAPRHNKSVGYQKTRTPTRISPKRKKRTPTATKSALENDISDSDEKSTVAAGSRTSDDPLSLTPTRSPALRAHNPKHTRMNFDIVRMSGSKVHDGRRSVEEEDPIVEADSSQSQSPSMRLSSSLLKRSTSRIASGRSSSSIKRRRLRINGPRSALEALEYADTKSSPTIMSRPIKTNTVSASTTERSPIQPLKLGPRVEMAATNNRWRGLRNDGNSCYVNSSLQQLFSVPKFMQAISRRKEGHKLAATLSDLYADLLDKNTIESSMHRDNVRSARQVKKVIDQLTDRFHGHQQRDAHEFLGELIDQIHEELALPSRENGGKVNEINGIDSRNKFESPRNDKDVGAKLIEPTDEFFRWNVQVCLKCKECGYSRCKEEMYRYLSIDIGNGNANPLDPSSMKPAVDSCLANFFAPEDREVNCEKCKDGKIATQTMRILSMPKVILLHLKRFIAVERLVAGSAGETELVFKKNKTPVELSTNLLMDKLLANHYSPGTTSAPPCNNYRLKSIVHHIGNTANSGHYTTDTLKSDPEDGRDLWVSFDDGTSVERSLQNVVSTTENQETAYMLLYSID